MKSRLTELSATLYKGNDIKIDKEEFEVISVKRKFHNGQAIQLDVTFRDNVDGAPMTVVITPQNVHEFI